MNTVRRRLLALTGPALLAGGMLFSLGHAVSCGEDIDDWNSNAVCRDYCAKKYDCDNSNPSNAEVEACVGACRQSIENECGNEHQAAANDRIGECVDMGCTDFWACMVFDTAPECYGFVNQ